MRIVAVTMTARMSPCAVAARFSGVPALVYRAMLLPLPTKAAKLGHTNAVRNRARHDPDLV